MHLLGCIRQIGWPKFLKLFAFTKIFASTKGVKQKGVAERFLHTENQSLLEVIYILGWSRGQKTWEQSPPRRDHKRPCYDERFLEGIWTSRRYGFVLNFMNILIPDVYELCRPWYRSDHEENSSSTICSRITKGVRIEEILVTNRTALLIQISSTRMRLGRQSLEVDQSFKGAFANLPKACIRKVCHIRRCSKSLGGNLWRLTKASR